jgi:hypothetical protein
MMRLSFAEFAKLDHPVPVVINSLERALYQITVIIAGKAFCSRKTQARLSGVAACSRRLGRDAYLELQSNKRIADVPLSGSKGERVFRIE